MLADKSDNNKELFPVVDIDGHVIGQAERGQCHGGSKLLHPVVHLHVFNCEGALFLQKRPIWKDIQPGKWDTAVGGHVDYGESIDQALRREAYEELGLTEIEPKMLAKYIFESQRERELVHAFVAVCATADVHPSAELDGGRFWAIPDILENIGKGIFTPNFEQEFIRLNLKDYQP